MYSANEFVEEQNDKAENELHDKVGLLRSLSINIGEEVRGHNHLLKETDDKFDRYLNMIHLTGTIQHSYFNWGYPLCVSAEKVPANLYHHYDFSLGGLLSTTIGKVKLLGNSGHRYYSLYLLLFCFFVFVVIWWIV